MQHDATSAWQVAQAQPPHPNDFKLRPPGPPAAPAPTNPQPPSPTQQVSPPQPVNPPPSPEQGTTQSKPTGPGPAEMMTPTSMLVSGAILLVLAIVFLLVSRSVRSHLIAHKASPSAAGSAGWALFAFLLAVAATSVFGFLGNLWSVLAFIVPMGVLIAVTLILCLVLLNAARRVTR